ncbi:hypothetical protein TNCV_3694531 [Trichonephila clavipes]|nr:hypothetical protein TNCV_3694531 [Trichonephila clavipes]
MGKNGDLVPCKKSEVKVLVNTKLFSNREISRRLKVSEASVRHIKKKIESGEELSPKRTKKCARKPIFTPRSERSLKKICLENRFSTTKVIKSQLQDINVNASERTVRRKSFEISQNKAQLVRCRREKFHSDCCSDCETPYKNNDLVSHQRQGYWTWLKV